MLRSRANTLLSVRRVTEINAGRKTAGVDGRTALLPQSKTDLVNWAQYRSSAWTPLPVKRVHIPKAGAKKRPLGIPVIRDRVLQARVVNALEPEWEARFEPKSYGFRGCRPPSPLHSAPTWRTVRHRRRRSSLVRHRTVAPRGRASDRRTSATSERITETRGRRRSAPSPASARAPWQRRTRLRGHGSYLRS